MSGERHHVLVVEDNDLDSLAIRRAFAKSESDPDLLVIDDADDAIDYLRGGERRPDLVILDLGLPGTDGTAVLEFVKSDPDLAPIPVVVFTTSDSDVHVLVSYRAHANCFLTKPIDARDMEHCVARLEEFFLRTAHLPFRVPRAA